MISPKRQRPSKADEKRAYAVASERDGDLCQMCLRWCGAPQRDHRKNRSQGGATTASNLLVLGESCHREKTEHPEWAVNEGWAVPAWGDPREWPTRRWFPNGNGTVRKGWALLDDEGGVREIGADVALARMGVL